MPDIDLDFPRDIREKLIPRVHERYGADRSALVAAFPTYRSRGAIRDLGKALGLPPGEIERVGAGGRHLRRRGGDRARRSPGAIGEQRAAATLRWRALAALCREALGLPRHASQHPGGMVISTRPLVEICPVVPAAMEGRQIVQWDKDSCADAGFLKIDLLGLGMLSAVERCVEEIGRARGERLDLSRIPLDDEPRPSSSIRARRDHRRLPDREPRADADAAAHPAARTSTTSRCRWRWCGRARSRAAPSTPTSSGASGCARTRPTRSPTTIRRWSRSWRETLGAIVFQEQVIEVAMALAGFRSGEAEGLRRAMSRKRSEAALRAYRDRFVRGRVDRGVSRRGRREGLPPDPAASRASASRRRTRPPSACSPTSRPGCGSTTGRSSSARC